MQTDDIAGVILKPGDWRELGFSVEFHGVAGLVKCELLDFGYGTFLGNLRGVVRGVKGERTLAEGLAMSEETLAGFLLSESENWKFIQQVSERFTLFPSVHLGQLGAPLRIFIEVRRQRVTEDQCEDGED